MWLHVEQIEMEKKAECDLSERINLNQILE